VGRSATDRQHLGARHLVTPPTHEAQHVVELGRGREDVDLVDDDDEDPVSTRAMTLASSRRPSIRGRMTAVNGWTYGTSVRRPDSK
jgi:hypothetical protein